MSSCLVFVPGVCLRGWVTMERSPCSGIYSNPDYDILREAMSIRVTLNEIASGVVGFGAAPVHLLKAVNRVNRATVGHMLQSGADVNASFNGVTALHMAALVGDLSIMELLIERQANVNTENDRNKHTPLFVAVCGGRTECARLLIDHRADVNAVDHHGNPLLWYGAMMCRTECVQLLLDSQVDINRGDGDDGAMMLHHAAGSSCAPLVKLLIERKVDVSKARDGFGMRTPLHTAAYNGSSECIELLVAAGARVNAQEQWGTTALHNAAFKGCEASVQALIHHRADVNATNLGRETPLHLATNKKNAAVIRILVAAKAEIDIEDRNGETPLFRLCCPSSHYRKNATAVPLVGLLIDNGASVDHVQTCGYTPLHMAAQNTNSRYLVSLLDRGASIDLSVSSSTCFSPLELAARRRHMMNFDILMNHGARWDATRPTARKVLQEVGSKGEREIFEVLFARQRMSLQDRDALNLSLDSFVPGCLEVLSDCGWVPGSDPHPSVFFRAVDHRDFNRTYTRLCRIAPREDTQDDSRLIGDVALLISMATGDLLTTEEPSTDCQLMESTDDAKRGFRDFRLEEWSFCLVAGSERRPLTVVSRSSFLSTVRQHLTVPPQVIEIVQCATTRDYF